MVFKGPTLAEFFCWQCGKNRMLRDVKFVMTNQEFIVESHKFLKDVCYKCEEKNLSQVTGKRKKRDKEVLQALKGNLVLDTEKSLEDLL